MGARREGKPLCWPLVSIAFCNQPKQMDRRQLGLEFVCMWLCVCCVSSSLDVGTRRRLLCWLARAGLRWNRFSGKKVSPVCQCVGKKLVIKLSFAFVSCCFPPELGGGQSRWSSHRMKGKTLLVELASSVGLSSGGHGFGGMGERKVCARCWSWKGINLFSSSAEQFRSDTITSGS